MVEGQSVSPKGKNSLCWRAQGGIGKPRLESVFSRVLPNMDASVHERMLVTSSHERLHYVRKISKMKTYVFVQSQDLLACL